MRFKELFPGIEIIFIVVCGVLLIFGSQLTAHWNTIDFCQNHTSAQRLLKNLPIYAPIDCLRIITTAPTLFPAHPPFSVLAFTPFALINFTLASRIWFYASILFYFFGLVILLKVTNNYSPVILFILSIFSIFWRVILINNSIHNMGHFIFFLIVLAFYFYTRKNPKLTGLIFGIISLIKIWPSIFIFIALLCRKFKIFMYAILTFFIGTLVSLILIGPSEYSNYVNLVIPNEKHFYPDPRNISIPGQITKIASGINIFNLLPLSSLNLTESTNIANSFGLGILLVLGAYISILSSRSSHKYDVLLLFGISPIIALLVFPVMWEWNILILLITVFIFTQFFQTHGISLKLLLAFLLISITIIHPDWEFPFKMYPNLRNSTIVYSLLSTWITLGLIILFGLLIYYVSNLNKVASKLPLPLSDKPSHKSK